MGESVFTELLEEVYKQEFSQYNNVPVFKTSCKHKLTMNRIFRIYEENSRRLHKTNITKTETLRPIRRVSLKAILLVILVVFLAVIAGCAVAYFISQNFRGRITNESTNILPINTEDCPTTIEVKYDISLIPMGFEKISDNSDPFSRTVEYFNSTTNQMIVFSQYTKSNFDSINFSNEKNDLEEIDINECKGVFIEQNNKNDSSGIVMWDNGYYVFEIFADLPKDEIVFLANATKIS